MCVDYRFKYFVITIDTYLYPLTDTLLVMPTTDEVISKMKGLVVERCRDRLNAAAKIAKDKQPIEEHSFTSKRRKEFIY